MNFNLGDYEAHDLAALFPAPSDEEYYGLREDIRLNSLRIPIVLYEGKILDGRSRLSACRDEGVEPRFVQFAGSDAVAYSVSQNLFRRHLTPSQRAILIAQFRMSGLIANSLPAGAEEFSSGNEALWQRVSARSIARAKVVLRKGHSAVVEAVVAGQLQLETARKFVVTVRDLDVQARLLSTSIERGGELIDTLRKEIRKYQAEIRILALPISDEEKRATLNDEKAAIDNGLSARKQAALARSIPQTEAATTAGDTLEALNMILESVAKLDQLAIEMLWNRLRRKHPPDPVNAGRDAYERASAKQREHLKLIQATIDLNEAS